MHQAEQRQKYLVIGAIAAVVLLAGDYLILSPLTSAWKSRAERIEALQAKVTKGELILARETNTRVRWDDFKKRGLSNDRSSSESDVIKLITQWSSDSNFNVSSIRPSWRDDDDEHVRLQCRVSGDGSLQSIARFLFHLDASDIAIRAETIELTARDKKGQKLGVDIQLSGLQIVEKEEPKKNTAGKKKS
ncbi:MAG: hypothetical protein ACI9VS_001459 [Candidatus Binatia bacterium]|jgi:hypothetical protein